MRDAAEEVAAWIQKRNDEIAWVTDALLASAPDSYPRRVVLEQEAPDSAVVVRLLDFYGESPRWPSEETMRPDPHPDHRLFRLSDVPEENQP